MSLQTQDYVFALIGFFNALWSWKLFGVLNRLDTRLAKMEGLQEGWDLDTRVTNLERELAHHKYNHHPEVSNEGRH